MAQSAPSRTGVRFEEWVTLLALPLSVALCNRVGKPFDFAPDSYYAFFLPAIGLFLVICCVAWAVRGRRSLGEGAPVGKLARVAGVIRDWWPLLACFAIYSNVKVLVPLFGPQVLDGAFLDWEQRVFGPLLGPGQYPTRWLLERAGPWSTWIMDKAYVSFFYLYSISFAVIYFGGFRREFRRLLTGIILLYYLGAALYLLVPVVGPIYHTDCSEVRRLVYQRSSELPRPPTVPLLQQVLLVNYAAVIESPGLFVTRPFLGIAAFPSLHVGHTLLFVLSARRVCRPLLILYLPILGLLTVSTVFWGWHWVGDVIAGAALALLVDPVLGRTLARDEVDGEAPPRLRQPS